MTARRSPLRSPLRSPMRSAMDSAVSTLTMQALAILRRPDIDAHVYLPGANGVAVSGLTSNNFTLSDGSSGYSSVDGTAGLVLDGLGGVGAVFKGAAAPLSGTTGFSAGYATISLVGSEIVATQTSGSYGQVIVNPILVPEIGKTYRVTATYRNITATNVIFQIQRGAAGGYATIATTGSSTSTTNQTREMVFTATATDCIINVTGNGTTGNTFGVTELYVQEITGIHATQSTTSAKPAERRGAYNLLTYSQDLSNAAWVLEATASKSGQTLLMPSVGDVVYHASTVAAGTCTLAFLLSGSGTMSLFAYNATNGIHGVQQITLTSTPTIYVSNITSTVANTAYYFGRWAGGTATSVTFGGGGLFAGTLTSAQILAEGGIPLTTTTAASNPSAGKYWWGFGGDDQLVCGSAPFQVADDFVLVGSLSQNTPSWTGCVTVDAGGGSAVTIGLDNAWHPQCYMNAGGTTLVLTASSTVLASSVNVVAMSKVGTTVKLFHNGAVVSTGSSSAVGTGAWNSMRIGAQLVGGGYVNGAAGPQGAIKGTMSDSDVVALMRFVALNTPNAPTF